jgi:protein subunit release factor A
MAKQLLFSLTKNDFDWEYFCTGGKGGQHRNAKKNGVRCIHRASGAIGEHRDGREQYLNRREAFAKCVNSQTFKKWHKLEVARRMNIAIQTAMTEQELKEKVDKMMQPEYINIETF